MTVGVLSPSVEGLMREEAVRPLALDVYEAPTAELDHIQLEEEPWWWVIVLGFVAYGITLWWADRCRRQGGNPSITFKWYRGYKVSCRG